MEKNIRPACDGHTGWLAVFCTAIMVTLVLWVASINGLGPIDDHQFIKTLFQGKSFGAYYSTELGRFFPLTAQEFVCASWVFGPSSRLFFAINAFKIMVLGWVLYQCLALTKASGPSIAILWCTAMLSIGLANAACRLHVGEFNILLLTLFFIVSTLSLDDAGLKPSKFRSMAVAGGVIALVTAFFYKELVFVFALAFGASELLRHYRQTHTLFSARLWAILIAGILYIAGYSIWRVLYCTGSYTGFQSLSSLNVISLFFGSDPFIVFLVLPLTLVRVVLIIRNTALYTIYDSFLLAASSYVVAFAVLGIYNSYYLLPAYGFAVCGLAGNLTLPSTRTAYKRIVLTVASIICANCLPVAVSDMQLLQMIANNHDRFVHKLSEWILNNPMDKQKPRHLVLVGVTPGNGIEVLISLKTFLVSLGTPESSFEVLTAEPTDNNKISTFYHAGNISGYTPLPDDLLIFNPYQNVVSPPPLLSPSYREVLRSESEWALPRWTGKEWLSYSLRGSHIFKRMLIDNNRYSGYAAMLLDRQKTHNLIKPLRSTTYQVWPFGLPSRMRSGTISQCEVLIQNTGKEVWPANSTSVSGMIVNISYRWFNNGHHMMFEGDRTPIPENMLPNDKAMVEMLVKTPDKPGNYTLMISPVQEGVQWFSGGNVQKIEIY